MDQDIDQLVELSLGFYPEAAVSGALLLQSETSTFLLFNAMKDAPGRRRTDAGTAV